jgi:site-specific recombinase XerC
LLMLAAQTGLRLSELISLDRDAIHLGVGAHVRCVGKGRKERCTPLTSHARGALRAWLKEPARRGASALFPNVHGGRLSADSIQSLLAKHVRVAQREMSIFGVQASVAARAEAQRRDGVAASGCRLLRDRTVARS